MADPPRRVVRVYDRGMERSPRAEPQSSVRPKATSSESVVRPKVTGSVPGQAGPKVTASRGCPRSPVGIGRGKQILEMRAKGLLKSRQSEPAGASFRARDIRLKDPSFKHGGYRVGPEGATKIKTSDGSKDQGRMSRVDPPKSKPSTRSGNSAPSPGVVPLMDLVLPPPAPSVPSSTRPCPPPPPPPPQPPRTAGPSAGPQLPLALLRERRPQLRVGQVILVPSASCLCCLWKIGDTISPSTMALSPPQRFVCSVGNSFPAERNTNNTNARFTAGRAPLGASPQCLQILVRDRSKRVLL